MYKQENLISDWIYKEKLYLIVFTVVFLLKTAWIWKLVPAISVRDELGMISSGAYFAGFDWSSVGTQNSYYGGGFSIIFALLIRLLYNKPILLYRVFLAILCVLDSVVAIISTYINKKYLNQSDILSGITGMCTSMLMVPTTTRVVNDVPYRFTVFLLLLLMIKLIFDYSDNIRNTFLFYIVLGWSYTIHARAKILVYALLITIVISLVIFHKTVVKEWTIIIGICIWKFCSEFNNYVLKNITGFSNSANMEVDIKASWTDLLDYEYIKTTLALIISKFCIQNIYMLGLGVPFVISLVILLFKINKKNVDIDEKKISIIMFFLILCIVGTELAFALNWGYSINKIIAGKEQDLYALKGLTYLRYSSPYLCALTIFLPYMINKYMNRKFINVSVIVSFVIVKGWTGLVFPIVKSYFTPYYLDNVYSLLFIHKGEEFRAVERWNILALEMILLTIVLLIINIKKRMPLVLGIWMFVLSIIYIENCLYFEVPINEARRAKYDKVINCIDKIQKDNDVFNIYTATTKTSSGIQTYHYLQLYYYDKKIIPIFDENEIIENGIDSTSILLYDKFLFDFEKMNTEKNYNIELIGRYVIISNED